MHGDPLPPGEGDRAVGGDDALVGDLAPVEAAYSLKTLVESLGGHVECRTDGAKLPAGNRSGYVGTATIEEVAAAVGLVAPLAIRTFRSRTAD